ncbi:Protein of unknown function DUF3741 [Macleaya cordata]|uniref:DUF4378 domain-containing protein n=1 Tax=Macleaya cordata TaxID=56857 RepID=A0A200QU87_MACCD|nr:Protein of unknown function DUF3741 [Macleaya cordata]
MGKRSQRNSLYREKHHTGCMSGLISIFDFRQGRSSQKLLPDRRHGSSRHAVGTGYSKNRLKLLHDVDPFEGKNDGDDNKTSKIDIGRRSVKKLMEEEMVSVQHPKKKIRTAAVESQEPEYSHLDLVALMEEFCSHVHQRLHHENKGDSSDGQDSISSVNHDQLDELDLQLVRKHTILEEKLSEAAEAFLNQKFIDAKQSTDGAIHQTQQFMDALDILNSNKDLLLKLLEDSNSLLVKHIQDLRDAQSEKGEPKKSLARTKLSEEEIVSSTQCQELVVRKQIQKQNMYKFFWRKAKSESKNSSKDSDSSPLASKRIVVLKPNPAGIQNSAASASPRSSTQFQYSLNSQGQDGRFNSKFSLREIKKKLKRVMGESKKEQHRISMDAILHKIPFEFQDSVHSSKGTAGEITGKEIPRNIHSHSEKAAKPIKCDPVNGHGDTSLRDDTCKNSTIEAAGYPKQRESNIYLEAKKHLSNMLSTREEDLHLSTSKVPKSLGKTLSLPEYISSPISSPRDTEHTFVTAQMRFSFSDNFGIVSENIWQPVKENHANLLTETELQTNDGIKLQVLDLNPDTSRELLPETIVQESILSCKGDSSPKGGVEIVETTESVCTEKSNCVDDPSETNSSTPTDRSNPSTETLKNWEEEGSSKSLMDANRKNEPSLSSLDSFSSNCLLDQKVEALENINDGPEWESPVSVLKPIFLEDVTSPATPMSDPAKLKIQPLRIRFDEQDAAVVVVTPSDPEIYLTTCMEDKKPTFEYVRAVLRASGLSWDEFMTNYCSSHQLLDPSLFDEVEVSSSQLCGDPELIFDCINEVLVEVYERYFGCPPWLKFIKSNIRPVPIGNSIIQEVWECIDWHLIPQPQPCTLDHIIGKDMSKEGTWVNLQFDIEEIGIQISEAILIELMEDTIFNLCS